MKAEGVAIPLVVPARRMVPMVELALRVGTREVLLARAAMWASLGMVMMSMTVVTPLVGRIYHQSGQQSLLLHMPRNLHHRRMQD